MEKKKNWRFIPLITAILSGLYFVLDRILCFAALFQLTGTFRWRGNAAGSVGIIGGADGPTAIFVTSTGDRLGLILSGVIFVVSVIVYIYLRKNELQKHQ